MKKREFTEDEIERITELYKNGYSRDKISYTLKDLYKMRIGHRQVQKVIDGVKYKPEIEKEHNYNVSLIKKNVSEVIKENASDYNVIVEKIENDYKMGIPIPRIQQKYKIGNKKFRKIIENTSESIVNEHNRNLFMNTRSYASRSPKELSNIIEDYANGISINEIKKEYKIGNNTLRAFIHSRKEYDELNRERESSIKLRKKQNKEIKDNRNIEDFDFNNGVSNIGGAGDILHPDNDNIDLKNIELDYFFGRDVKHPNFSVYGRIDLIKPHLMGISGDEYTVDENGITYEGSLMGGNLHYSSVITKGLKGRLDYENFIKIIDNAKDNINMRRLPYIKDFDSGEVYMYYNGSFPDYERRMGYVR